MSESVVIFGIKACDTMKKSMTWLADKGVTFEFHDYKKQGISEEKLRYWLSQVEWDVLINKRGTTWRKLSDADKENIDNDKAVTLMLSNQSLIKRPLLESGGKIYLGFKPGQYNEIFP